MPVKVRCPTCDKVLNAPEAARGKAVKCPGCETKVKVPVGDTSAGSNGGKKTTRPATAKVKAKKETDDDFLADLDLDKLVDSSDQMCPKCGAQIPEDATECPKCGVDPSTGQLSASARKRKSLRGGVDPALFYSVAWGDAWRFTLANFTVVVRTAVYMLAFTAVQSGCSFMAQWCETWPPKTFWGVMYVVSSLVIPGWIWCLTIETVRVTVGRKDNIRKIHFDVFQNMALGLKTIFWLIAFCWFPPAYIMEPLAMIHMAMPVTKRGWLNFAMLPTFFRNFLPTMYIWIIRIATNLVWWAMVGVAAFFAAATVIAYVAALRGTGERPEQSALIVTGVVLGVVGVIAVFLYSFSLIYNMRVLGQMAYYFKDTLDLVVLVSEKTYVRKEVPVDKWGNPIKTTGQKVGTALLAVGVLLLLIGVGFFLYYQMFKKSS
jgi:hypothetical protein